MAAPAFALLWADQSEAAPFRAGHSPGATVFAAFCSSPASLVACLFIINENGRIGRELRYEASPGESDSRGRARPGFVPAQRSLSMGSAGAG